MALTAQDDTLFSGDDHSLSLTAKDADDNTLDITGASFNWGLYRSKVSANAEITKQSGVSPSEIEIANAAAGLVTVFLFPTDTSAISGDFYHELQMAASNGKITTVAFGTLTIKGDQV